MTTRNSRAAAAPVTGSALAPISTTCPANFLPGSASSVTVADWPRAMASTSASATFTSVSMVLRSEIVISVVPG